MFIQQHADQIETESHDYYGKLVAIGSMLISAWAAASFAWLFVSGTVARADPVNPANARGCLMLGEALVAPSRLGVRGTDAWGSGAYDAARDGGRRRHAGVDFAINPGEPVFAPAAGVVTNLTRPYRDTDAFGGVEITTAGNCRAVIYYVQAQVRVGQTVEAGDIIGVAQDVATRYAHITPHVHFELRSGRQALDPREAMASETDYASARQ